MTVASVVLRAGAVWLHVALLCAFASFCAYVPDTNPFYDVAEDALGESRGPWAVDLMSEDAAAKAQRVARGDARILDRPPWAAVLDGRPDDARSTPSASRRVEPASVLEIIGAAGAWILGSIVDATSALPALLFLPSMPPRVAAIDWSRHEFVSSSGRLPALGPHDTDAHFPNFTWATCASQWIIVPGAWRLSTASPAFTPPDADSMSDEELASYSLSAAFKNRIRRAVHVALAFGIPNVVFTGALSDSHAARRYAIYCLRPIILGDTTGVAQDFIAMREATFSNFLRNESEMTVPLVAFYLAINYRHVIRLEDDDPTTGTFGRRVGRYRQMPYLMFHCENISRTTQENFVEAAKVVVSEDEQFVKLLDRESKMPKPNSTMRPGMFLGSTVDAHKYGDPMEAPAQTHRPGVPFGCMPPAAADGLGGAAPRGGPFLRRVDPRYTTFKRSIQGGMETTRSTTDNDATAATEALDDAAATPSIDTSQPFVVAIVTSRYHLVRSSAYAHQLLSLALRPFPDDARPKLKLMHFASHDDERELEEEPITGLRSGGAAQGLAGHLPSLKKKKLSFASSYESLKSEIDWSLAHPLARHLFPESWVVAAHAVVGACWPTMARFRDRVRGQAWFGPLREVLAIAANLVDRRLETTTLALAHKDTLI